MDTSATESDGSPKIVGISQWAVFNPGETYREVMDYAPDATWPDPLEKCYANHLWESYIEPRRRAIRNETLPVVSKQRFPVYT